MNTLDSITVINDCSNSSSILFAMIMAVIFVMVIIAKSLQS